ncbi:hypothetical protein MXL15_05055 [Pseudomonas mosselii]|uniref:hypothetical protein n=1 Tax=Pseudomonas mosselii TaxID=78327 RepID=UPI002DBFDEE8|nr:hypothetical protein [Pseudomonas mosselii]MEB5931569.1 hypothetical protein [Pseudomonas mosselii]
MIDLSDWSAGLKVASLLIPFFIMLLGMAIHVHIAISQHFDVMCAALRRSKCLLGELKRGGGFTLKFRALTVSVITGVLLWPVLSMRQGDLDPQDYREFPVYLRRRMRVAAFCIFTALSESACIVGSVDFTRS